MRKNGKQTGNSAQDVWKQNTIFFPTVWNGKTPYVCNTVLPFQTISKWMNLAPRKNVNRQIENI